MESNELRIGNWITIGKNKTVMQVLEITFDIRLGHCVNQKDLPVTLFEGIELTEDILLKCGFYENYNKVFTLELSEQRLLECENGLVSIRFDIDIDRHEYRYEGEHYLNTSIKYLHQLQNCFHALTQKELTVQL